MVAPFEKRLNVEEPGSEPFRNGMMIALTAFFVLLYSAALLGWLRPVSDLSVFTRLEPIIFVIIGYYFGRQSGHRSEKRLKDEADRQTKKAEAAQAVKEKAQIEREVMEEKLKGVKVLVANLERIADGGERDPSVLRDTPALRRHPFDDGSVKILRQILEQR